MARRRKRLIDVIPLERDRVKTPNDWTWFMEPFTRSFHLSAEEAAKKAYVDVASKFASLRYLAKKIEATLALGEAPATLRHNLDVLRAGNRPILLVGEPGVGKTTWMLHFFSRQWIRKQTYHVRVNGSASKSALSDSSQEEYIRKRLRKDLTREMCRCAKALDYPIAAANLTDSDDSDQVEDAIRVSAKELRSKNRAGFVLFDNFDRKSRQVQQTVIEYANNICDMGLHAIVALRPYTLGCDQVMDDLPCVTVAPPSIVELMRTRIDYALQDRLGKDLVAQIESGTGANLRWTGGAVNDEAGLRRLWAEVAQALSDLSTLREHLFCTHLADLHEITEDLRELLSSGYFCSEMMRRLRNYLKTSNRLYQSKAQAS